MPAEAVTGYDSAYNSESAFVTINPGETQSFQVFFFNGGSIAWIKGTDSQVDLAACLEDKVTCNAQDASEATWNSGWLSATRYATTTQASVARGQVATFSFNIKAPANATGTHRFNGDLVVAMTGVKIHAQGYYQDAIVNAVGQTGPTPTPIVGVSGPGGSTTGGQNCEQQGQNQGNNANCPPPPVIPEAPFAALLPLGAVALFGGALLLSRRRARSPLGPRSNEREAV
jgi:hypothetical protein